MKRHTLRQTRVLFHELLIVLVSRLLKKETFFHNTADQKLSKVSFMFVK
jgi:hypothetical protein